ncbi:MAG TPA: hypothetical protein VGD78_19490, partial [Chthoniobacterales bacterium]
GFRLLIQAAEPPFTAVAALHGQPAQAWRHCGRFQRRCRRSSRRWRASSAMKIEVPAERTGAVAWGRNAGGLGVEGILVDHSFVCKIVGQGLVAGSEWRLGPKDAYPLRASFYAVRRAARDEP